MEMSKNRYFADDCWAFWIDGDDSSTLYISDWINPKGNSYVDVAVHARGIKGTKSLNIYIPFPVTSDEITDISMMFWNKSVLYAIFNSACIVDFEKNECTSELAYQGKTVDLVHISKLKYNISQLADGSLFTLDFDQLQNSLANDEAYFIFRIPHKSLNAIFSSRVCVDSYLKRVRKAITTPVIDEKYGYSVRINESRSLPSEITRLVPFHRQKLRRTLISLSIDEDYDVGDQGCYCIRRLEENIYNDYIPEGFSCDNAITYQWDQRKEKSQHGHFNFYFSIARNSISKTSMGLYMILLIVFSGAGSALCELVMRLFGA